MLVIFGENFTNMMNKIEHICDDCKCNMEDKTSIEDGYIERLTGIQYSCEVEYSVCPNCKDVIVFMDQIKRNDVKFVKIWKELQEKYPKLEKIK